MQVGAIVETRYVIADGSLHLLMGGRAEWARLDALQHRLWPSAMAGNRQAIRRVVRLIKLRARLLGLQLPPQEEQAPAEEEAVQHTISVILGEPTWRALPAPDSEDPPEEGEEGPKRAN